MPPILLAEDILKKQNNLRYYSLGKRFVNLKAVTDKLMDQKINVKSLSIAVLSGQIHYLNDIDGKIRCEAIDSEHAHKALTQVSRKLLEISMDLTKDLTTELESENTKKQ